MFVEWAKRKRDSALFYFYQMLVEAEECQVWSVIYCFCEKKVAHGLCLVSQAKNACYEGFMQQCCVRRNLTDRLYKWIVRCRISWDVFRIHGWMDFRLSCVDRLITEHVGEDAKMPHPSSGLFFYSPKAWWIFSKVSRGRQIADRLVVTFLDSKEYLCCFPLKWFPAASGWPVK